MTQQNRPESREAYAPHLIGLGLTLLAMVGIVFLLIDRLPPEPSVPLVTSFQHSRDYGPPGELERDGEARVMLNTDAGGPTLVIVRLRPPDSPEQKVTVTYDRVVIFEGPLGPLPRQVRVISSNRPGLLLGIMQAAHAISGSEQRNLPFDYVRVERLAPEAVGRGADWLMLLALGGGIALVLVLLTRFRWHLPQAFHRLLASQQRYWVPGNSDAANPGAWFGLLATLALIATYTTLLSYYSLLGHQFFKTNAYDLGIFDQSLWLLSRGLYPYSTAVGMHVLGDHAAILFYPLAALYWLCADVRVLLVFQSLVLALGALPLFWIARDHGIAWLGLLIGAAYLAHPSTHNANLFDFHPDTIGTTALLFALWGVTRQRWALVIIMAGLMLASKENFGITVGALGMWLLAHRHWRVGGILVVLGFGWFLLATRLMLPAFLNGPQTRDLARFARFGDSFGAIAQTFLLRPQVVLADIFQPLKIWYILQLLLPLGLLPLVSPRYFVLALPALGLNLLSDFSAQQTLTFHYNLLIVAILAVATLHGLLWLSRQRAGMALACAALLAVTSGSWYIHHYTFLRIADIRGAVAHEQRDSFYRHYILSLIPPDASVTAQNQFHPHLTHRQQAFMFPNPFISYALWNPDAMPFAPTVDYIIYDYLRPDDFYLSATEKRRLLRDLEERGLYQRVVELDGVVLLQRTTKSLPDTCFGSGWRAQNCIAGMSPFSYLSDSYMVPFR